MRKTNDISGQRPVQLLPKVVVIAADLEETVREQTYKNMIVVPNKDNENTSMHFNEQFAAHKEQTDFVIFLPKSATFATCTAVEQIVKKFIRDELRFGGIYTDSLAVNGDSLVPELLPAFTPAMLSSGMIMNNPIAVQTKTMPPAFSFNAKITHIHSYDLMRQLAMHFLLVHLAEPLYTITREPYNLEQEMSYLYE